MCEIVSGVAEIYGSGLIRLVSLEVCQLTVS